MTQRPFIDPSELARPLRLQLDNFTDNMWGGDWIPRLKGLGSRPVPVGESWEFSAHPAHPSAVALRHGFVSMPALMSAAGDKILGERLARRLAGRPPFLLKFIDSLDDLSVQVHPSDAHAGSGDGGKTESWVILEADRSAGGCIYIGFDPRKADGFAGTPAFAEAFLGAISQANAQGPSEDPAVRAKAERLVLPFLNRVPVEAGEVYHIPAGTIHAIGRGVRLFEVQQSSDLTYRVWDWNRPDAKKLKLGERVFRELHLDRARDVLDFNARPPSAYRMEPAPLPITGEGPRERLSLVLEPGRLYGAERWRLAPGAWTETPEGFSILTAVEGEFSLGEGPSAIELKAGSSAIVPACCVDRRVDACAPSTLIRCYVPA